MTMIQQTNKLQQQLEVLTSEEIDLVMALKVDVVTRNGLKARIRERVLAEVIYL